MASFLKKVFAHLQQHTLSSHDHDERYYTETKVDEFRKFMTQLFIGNEEEVCHG